MSNKLLFESREDLGYGYILFIFDSLEKMKEFIARRKNTYSFQTVSVKGKYALEAIDRKRLYRK